MTIELKSLGRKAAFTMGTRWFTWEWGLDLEKTAGKKAAKPWRSFTCGSPDWKERALRCLELLRFGQ